MISYFTKGSVLLGIINLIVAFRNQVEFEDIYGQAYCLQGYGSHFFFPIYPYYCISISSVCDGVTIPTLKNPSLSSYYDTFCHPDVQLGSQTIIKQISKFLRFVSCGNEFGQLVMTVKEDGKYFFECQYETTEDKIRCYYAQIIQGIYKCLYCHDYYYGENCENKNYSSISLQSKCEQKNPDGSCLMCYPGNGKRSYYDKDCLQKCFPYTQCYVDNYEIIYQLPCQEDGAIQLGTRCVSCNITKCSKCELDEISQIEICLKCRYPFVLINNKCLGDYNCLRYENVLDGTGNLINISCIECLYGYFWDTVFNKCSSCGLRKSCPICNASGCLYCRPGLVLLNQKCETLICGIKHCLFCQLDDPNECTVCNFGIHKFKVSTGECECNINDNKGDYYGSCQTCVILYCAQCNPTPYSCTYCDDFIARKLIGNSCVCKPLYYEYYDVTATDACHQTCYNCQGSTANDCIGCGNPSLIHRYLTAKGECLCINGYGNKLAYFSQQNAILPELESCHNKCAQCFRSVPGTSLEYCTKCHEGQNRELSDDLDCVCQENYSDDALYDICYKCYYTCAQCYGILSTNCVRCSTQSHRYLSTNKECLCSDQYYDDNLNMECLKCHYTCLNCLSDPSPDKCTECPSTRISINVGSTFLCYCQQIGYYDLDGSMECQPCHYSCLTCDGSEIYNCLSCDTNYREFDSVQCNCPIGFYDIGNLQCEQCHHSCYSCDNINYNNCLECSLDLQYRIQIESTCICIQGYYDIIGTSICGKCSYKCLSCQDTYDHCLSCPLNSGRQLESNNLCSCTSEYYDQIDNPICKLCHFKCYSCTDQTEQSCSSCNPNKFRTLSNNQCICMNGYFEKEVQECQKCSSQCQLCIDEYDYCTACLNDRYLDGNKCLCKTKWQGYKISTYELRGILKCQVCHYTCLTCSKSSAPDQCLSCFDSDNRIQIGSTCICKDGYFEVGKSVCQKCSIQCKLCITKDDKCIGCEDNTLRVLNSILHKCLCPIGYFDDGQISVCQQCHYTCQTCSKLSTLCNDCSIQSHRQLNDLLFTCSCNLGYFDSGIQQCQLCHYSCLGCANSFQNCLSCTVQIVSKRVLYQNQCICISGYYDDGFSKNCQQCNYECLTCTIQSYQCTSCPQTRNINQNCACSNGYYDIGYATCSKCDANCFKCAKFATKCIECNSLDNRTLNITLNNCECKLGYYELNGICYQCDQTCQTCIDQSDNCKSCPSNRILIGSTCKCSDDYYENKSDKLCYLCHKSCQTCINTSTECLSCFIDDFRILKQGQKCECIDGYYENLTNLNCLKCDYTCLTCQYNAYHCTSCDSSLHYDIHINQCLCTTQYYYDITTKLCQQCHFTCLQCRTQNECTTCNTLTRQLDNYSMECLCKIGYFEINSEYCQQCHYSCYTCLLSSTNCQTCSQLHHRSLYNNSCQCLQGYYDLGVLMCQKCNDLCQTCQILSTKCTSCYQIDQHRILQGDQCICQTGYFSTGSLICQKCSNSCLTCEIMPNSCTSCDLSSKRYDRSIQRKCPCITGFYEDENQNCQRCHIKCYDCINSSEICTSCNYKVNSNRNSLSQQCNCKEGYYDDVTQIQCQKCNNKCKKCLNDSINCSICNNNLRSNPPVCNCIDGYFEDEQQTCQPCYHQCSTCDTNQNNCLSCKPDRFGPNCECSDGYYEAGLINCLKCQFQCKTCSYDANLCITCKADRIQTPICKCPNGKYDDYTNETCQDCHYTCNECNIDGCISCAGNRILSQENTCDSPFGSISYENTPWCSSCTVAVLRIYFSDDLESLIILFDFPLNSKLFQSYQLSNKCFQIFDITSIDKFGRNPNCYINPDQNSELIISLGDYPNINLGDQLLFQKNSLSHNSCEQPLSTFVNNNIQPPKNYLIPQIQFDVPQYKINPCVEIQIYQNNRKYDGKRSLINAFWSYTSSNGTNLLIDHFISQQNIQQDFNLIIPSNTLPINSKITFFISFQNFLTTSSEQHFIITTHSGDSPTITLNIKKQYFTFEKISLNFQIQTILCFNNINSTPEHYIYAVELFQLQNISKQASESEVIYNVTSLQESHSIIIPQYKLSPNFYYTFQLNVTNQISKHNQIQNFTIQIMSAGILCQFKESLNVQYFAKDMNLVIQCKDLDTNFNWNQDPDLFTEIQCFELTKNQKCQNIHNAVIPVNKTERLQYIKKFSIEPFSIQEWSLKVTKKNTEQNFKEVIVFLEYDFEIQKIEFNSGYQMRDINNFELLNFTFSFNEQQYQKLIDYSVGIIYDYQIIKIISPTFVEFKFKLFECKLFECINQMNRGNEINLRFNAQFSDNIMPNLFNLKININQPVPCQKLLINQINLEYTITAICEYSNSIPYYYQLKYFYLESDYNLFLKSESDNSITFQSFQKSNKFTLQLPTSMNSSNINVLVQVMNSGGSITSIYQKFSIKKQALNCTQYFNLSQSVKFQIYLLFEGYNNDCLDLSEKVLENLKQMIYITKNAERQIILSTIKLFNKIQSLKQLNKSQTRLMQEQQGLEECYDQKQYHFIVYGGNKEQNVTQNQEKNKIVKDVSQIENLIFQQLLNIKSIVEQINLNQIFWDHQLEQEKEFLIDSLFSSLFLIDDIFLTISFIKFPDLEMFNQSMLLIDQINIISSVIQQNVIVDGIHQKFEGVLFNLTLKRFSKKHMNELINIEANYFDYLVYFCQLQQMNLIQNPYLFQSNFTFLSQNNLNTQQIKMAQQPMKKVSLKNFFKEKPYIIIEQINNYIINFNNYSLCEVGLSVKEIFDPICIMKTIQNEIQNCTLIQEYDKSLNQVSISCQCSYLGEVLLLRSIISQNLDQDQNTSISQLKPTTQLSLIFTDAMFIIINFYCLSILVTYFYCLYKEIKSQKQGLTIQQCEINTCRSKQTIHLYPGNVHVFAKQFKYLHQITALCYQINHMKLSAGVLCFFSLISFTFLLLELEFLILQINLGWIYGLIILINCIFFEIFRGILKIIRSISQFGRIINIIFQLIQLLMLLSPLIGYIIMYKSQTEWNLTLLIINYLSSLIIILIILDPIIVFIRIYIYKLILPSIKNNELNPFYHLLYFFVYHETLEIEFSQYQLF
ncbi:unnamed protein product [Paramecium sonneborni]|uniref:EGF-like domain-containing protein n=1 Tax=Paramecium sonneborni TaxID=65129 RepID=A0A8S1Q0Y7_9CILI|nr:unnamed protein product [Paramecium sonneborni]